MRPVEASRPSAPHSARRRARLATRALVAGTLLIAGCETVNVVTDLPPAGSARVFHVHRWFWGLFGGAVDMGATPIARVVVDRSLCDGLLTWVTFGFYCPTYVLVWSAEEQDPELKHIRER
jgi:hypothetical protein